MGSIAEQVHDSRSSLLAGAIGPSLIKTTLLGIAMKAAADWIKNTAGTAMLRIMERDLSLSIMQCDFTKLAVEGAPR